jgi:hypothetical protein
VKPVAAKSDTDALVAAKRAALALADRVAETAPCVTSAAAGATAIVTGPVCSKFARHGNCRRGWGCPFSHDIDAILDAAEQKAAAAAARVRRKKEEPPAKKRPGVSVPVLDDKKDGSSSGSDDGDDDDEGSATAGSTALASEAASSKSPHLVYRPMGSLYNLC